MCPSYSPFFIQSITKLLKQNGFSINKIKTFSLEYGGFGMLGSLLNFFQ